MEGLQQGGPCSSAAAELSGCLIFARWQQLGDLTHDVSAVIAMTVALRVWRLEEALLAPGARAELWLGHQLADKLPCSDHATCRVCYFDAAPGKG